MEIQINNLQSKIPISNLQLIKIIKTVLISQKIKRVELSIIFVTRQRIQSINKKFLARSYATDVIAFDNTEDAVSYKSNKSVKEILGDIFISTDAVLKNSKEYNTRIKDELILYVIHGICHLLGFDDHGNDNIARMRRKESELMRLVEELI